MEHHTQDQQGFALPVAIFAIVIVGVLVTGGFFVARQESRIGVADENAQLAFYMAEKGIADIVDTVSASTLNNMSLWDTVTYTDSLDEGTVDVRITRTAERLYFLDGTSRITGRGHLGGGTRRLGMMMKLFTAEIDPPAALSTTGNARVGGSSVINGYDSVPTGWDNFCDTTTSMEDKPGVLINETDSITYVGNNFDTLGSPQAVMEDTTLTPDSLLTFGESDWDDLVALADLYLDAPELSTGNVIRPRADSIQVGGTWVCNEANEANWGDPINPGGVCGGYFPIIYADSAHSTPLKLQGNQYGQGILLVEHDLQVAGGFTFFGVVIVRGTFSTSGTGGHVQGGVIAANANFDQSTVIGDAVIQNSTCGVTRAVLGNKNLARLRPLAERTWVDLSNVGN